MAGNIQFQEPQYGQATGGGAPGSSGLTGLVIRLGLARDAASAQKVLLIVLAVAVLGILASFFFVGGSAERPPAVNIDGTPLTQ